MFQRISEFGKGTFFCRMPFQKLIEIRSIPHRLLTQEQTNSTCLSMQIFWQCTYFSKVCCWDVWWIACFILKTPRNWKTPWNKEEQQSQMSHQPKQQWKYAKSRISRKKTRQISSRLQGCTRNVGTNTLILASLEEQDDSSTQMLLPPRYSFLTRAGRACSFPCKKASSQVSQHFLEEIICHLPVQLHLVLVCKKSESAGSARQKAHVCYMCTGSRTSSLSIVVRGGWHQLCVNCLGFSSAWPSSMAMVTNVLLLPSFFVCSVLVGVTQYYG